MKPLFQKLPQEKQIKILDAAIRVFAKYGYYHANVESICKEADIANGSLYRYFGSKENLCICAYNHVIEVMFETIYDIDMYADKSVFEIIRTLLLATEKSYRQRPHYFWFYTNIWATEMNSFVPRLSLQSEENIDNFWIELIKIGQKNGEIDKMFSPECAAYLIDSQTLLYTFSLASSYHKKHLDSFLRPDGNEDSESVIDKILDSLRLSLSPRS